MRLSRFLLAFASILLGTPGSVVAQAGAGSALRFDGVDDFIRAPDHPLLDGTSQLTLECWFLMTQPAPTSEGEGLINKFRHYTTNADDAYSLRIWQSGQVFCQVVGANGTYVTLVGPNSNVIGQWHHVALAFQQPSLTLYLDGVSVATAWLGSPINAVAAPLTIGSLALGNDQPWTFFFGEIDEVRIWNVARSQAQIVGAMNACLTGTEAGLVAYHRFDAGWGQIAVDSGPNGIDATLGGSTLATNADPSWVLSGASISCGPIASYTTFGPGCAGSLGTSSLTAVVLPRIGQTMTVNVNNLPQAAALLLVGLSNSTSSFGTLPLQLSAFGMPGCSGRVSPDLAVLVFGAGTATAVFNFAIPNNQGLPGLHFYHQALVFDVLAGNAAGAAPAGDQCSRQK